MVDAKAAASAAWDTEHQEVHGGQTWRLCDSFVEDFSVTTNAFGAPAKAMQEAQAALAQIHHYPAADCKDAIRDLAEFMRWPENRLLVGNGASEFIDLVMRAGPAGSFQPGPYDAAYMEYNRAAVAAGRSVMKHDDPATPAITVVIHPNSPTGHCMSLQDIERRAQLAKQTSSLLVLDESFMPFFGPDWHAHSALSLIDKYPETVIVINSWTKLWSCPGLRLGSVACGEQWYKTFKKLQTPWSCNTLAQAFCSAAARDTGYMERTWNTLPGWKQRQQELLVKLGWTVNEQSPLWVPWVFVDCGSADAAEQAAAVAQEVGCPVRWCASFGTPRNLRLGIRAPEHQDVLQAAWEKAFGIVSPETSVPASVTKAAGVSCLEDASQPASTSCKVAANGVH
ncbi:Histidinol-phosphate aminotransferase 2 [Porphyridium purpureum]|uniref:Histidinol-phosphate aminotransferase 2 n=1 Tax=Porphyridium purpureum TaxID=35688 RepID=A0A5J4YZU8_PORPP|nr:Histidinol-phosphate aminotransferase 2 [Porphyridium purpureum]|eukprot:POR2029..scf208_2